MKESSSVLDILNISGTNKEKIGQNRLRSTLFGVQRTELLKIMFTVTGNILPVLNVMLN